MKALHIDQAVFAAPSTTYPGHDPRQLRIDARGDLWMEDFQSGLFRWEGDHFTHEPAVNEKGTGVAIDQERDRRWFLHYTRGLVVVRGTSPPEAVDLGELGYMRDLALDPATGDVWVAGYNQIVRVRAVGSTWDLTRFRVE